MANQNLVLDPATGAMTGVAPSAINNVLKSDGSAWVAGPSPTGVLPPCRVGVEGGSYTYTIVSGTVTQINGTTLDGVAVAVGDRILVTGAPAASGVGSSGTTQPGNGVYVVTGNTTNITLTRAVDMSGSVSPWGLSVFVCSGPLWGGYAVYWNGTGAFTWGTTALGYSTYFQPAVYVTPNGTYTLPNKRITPRIGTVASSATPTINTNSFDQFNITAQAAAITSMTTNLSGTPTDGERLAIRIKDDGTARAITWGAKFVAGPAALLSTTVISKTHYNEFRYDTVPAVWVCVISHTAGY